jgi:serine/threonine protein kinase
MEFSRFGDASTLAENHCPPRPSPLQVCEVVRQIGRALDYLHTRHGLMHCDVKPRNMLVRRLHPIFVTLCDFGYACATGAPPDDYRGTRCFVAPEVAERRWGFGVDAWSLGVSALMLGWFPRPLASPVRMAHDVEIIYEAERNEDAFERLLDERAEPRELLLLVWTMLEQEPAKRGTALECASRAAEIIERMPSDVPCRSLQKRGVKE